MATTTVSQLAAELNRPPAALLEQLKSAGVSKASTDDSVTETDKARLLDHLFLCAARIAVLVERDRHRPQACGARQREHEADRMRAHAQRAPASGIQASGTVNVSPNWELKRIARSLERTTYRGLCLLTLQARHRGASCPSPPARRQQPGRGQ